MADCASGRSLKEEGKKKESGEVDGKPPYRVTFPPAQAFSSSHISLSVPHFPSLPPSFPTFSASIAHTELRAVAFERARVVRHHFIPLRRRLAFAFLQNLSCLKNQKNDLGQHITTFICPPIGVSPPLTPTLRIRSSMNKLPFSAILRPRSRRSTPHSYCQQPYSVGMRLRG